MTLPDASRSTALRSTLHSAPLALLILPLLGLSGCADLGRAVRISSASTSRVLCSAAFVSHLNPDQTYAEEVRPEGGMGWVDWGLRYQVNREQRAVTTQIAGRASSRAVYREGLGCMLDFQTPLFQTSNEVLAARYHRPPLPAPTLPPIADDQPVVARDPALQTAMNDAFAEPPSGQPRNTKAIVVLHQGKVIAEQYAPGIGVHTPLNGHSITKSVTSALIGILVQQARVQPTQAAPGWAVLPDADPRRHVTLEQLMRMSSGLSADETFGGFDPATRMWFDEPDMTAFAEQASLESAPGQAWNYSDRGYTLLSRLVRDSVTLSNVNPAAQAASATTAMSQVMDFAHRELFGPLGMADVTLEFDATGTPVGSSSLFASARDWARFGQLYLGDGMAGTQRILPVDWVDKTRRPTLDAGYGMGFWLNNTQSRNPWGEPWGLPGAPADAYFGRGYLGQFVVIVPSRQLVVVRLGVSHRAGGDVASVGQLVTRAVAVVDGMRAQPADQPAPVVTIHPSNGSTPSVKP